MNGSPPISRMNGHTPSPPPPTSGTGGGGGRDGVTSGGGGTQPLPPACGARQLSKLKRFLTTLQQFGSDISPEIGDRVRTLVLGLVNNHLSIEEFHNKLQEATNFPLRPFVIPFLKANLPLLQRELLHCARLAKQSPQQYLAHNEHILFNASHSPTARDQITSPEINENGKRSSPDRCQENGFDRIPDGPPPAKRHQSHSPAGGPLNRLSPGGSYPTNTSSHYGSTPGSGGGGIHSGGQIRLDDIREIRERERIERERSERERAERDRERERHYYTGYPSRSDYTYDALDHQDDDWKHLETMLHCIVGMVDKAKRALVVLQERSQRDREEITYWVRRNEGDKKRTAAAGNNTNHYTRHQDDRLADVKRRAEEAVNAVKRQAVEELQKAVAAAEQNAADMVTAERAKMERMMGEIRRQARDEMASMIAAQEESSESCWNCGRKASETCSGCNTARYCGAFCQHKDWENHHRVCGANGTTNNNKPSLNNTADTSAGGASSRYDDHHHQHHRRTTNVTDTHHSPSPPIAKTEAPTPPASNSTANPNATTPPAESGDGGVPIVVEPPVSPTPSHHSHYSTSSQPPNTNTHNTHSHTHHTPPNTADTSPTSRSRPSSPPPPHTSSSPSSSSTSPSTDVKPKVSSSHHHHKSKSRSSSPHHDKREAKR